LGRRCAEKTNGVRPSSSESGNNSSRGPRGEKSNREGKPSMITDLGAEAALDESDDDCTKKSERRHRPGESSPKRDSSSIKKAVLKRGL